MFAEWSTYESARAVNSSEFTVVDEWAFRKRFRRLDRDDRLPSLDRIPVQGSGRCFKVICHAFQAFVDYSATCTVLFIHLLHTT